MVDWWPKGLVDSSYAGKNIGRQKSVDDAFSSS